MAFTDEQIQRMRREAKQKNPPDFSQPLFINEEEYHFTRTMLYDNTVSLMLPQEFVDMPQDIAKQKYPMEQRPQIIQTNLSLRVNFAFNQFDQQVPDDQIGEAAKAFQTLIKRMQPANRFFDEKTETHNEMTISWFDFKSPGLDEPLYTIMAFASIDGKLLHCLFNSAFRIMGDWKLAALTAFRSIQDETRI